VRSQEFWSELFSFVFDYFCSLTIVIPLPLSLSLSLSLSVFLFVFVFGICVPLCPSFPVNTSFQAVSVRLIYLLVHEHRCISFFSFLFHASYCVCVHLSISVFLHFFVFPCVSHCLFLHSLPKLCRSLCVPDCLSFLNCVCLSVCPPFCPSICNFFNHSEFSPFS
jgi:hypothetical protein